VQARPRAPLVEPAARSHTGTWVAGAGAALTLAAGTALALRSRSAADELAARSHPRSDTESLLDRQRSNAILADVLFAATLALGLTAVFQW
jgi:hypothetical protein